MSSDMPLQLKEMPPPDGFIDPGTADRLQLRRSPYRGPPLKALGGATGIDPREQISVKWQLSGMKKPCKSILAIHDLDEVNCIIGYPGLISSKIWKLNPEIMDISR